MARGCQKLSKWAKNRGLTTQIGQDDLYWVGRVGTILKHYRRHQYKTCWIFGLKFLKLAKLASQVAKEAKIGQGIIQQIC